MFRPVDLQLLVISTEGVQGIPRSMLIKPMAFGLKLELEPRWCLLGSPIDTHGVLAHTNTSQSPVIKRFESNEVRNSK